MHTCACGGAPIATCTSGVFHSTTVTNTLFAHMVVPPEHEYSTCACGGAHSATTAGGVFIPTIVANSSHALKQLAMCGGSL